MIDAATCTGNGWVIPQYQERVRCKKYEDDMFLYDKITQLSIIVSQMRQDERSSSLRRSLFAHVAPYVKFHTFDDKRQCEMPESVTKHLKFMMEHKNCHIVRKTLIRSGCSLTDKFSECFGTWGKRVHSVGELEDLKTFLKMNTIPGTLQLSRKDTLWHHLSAMIAKFGKDAFGFIPNTYVLPRESSRLRKVWEESRSKKKWIIKPPEADSGDGIQIINKWWEIPTYRSIIVQRYLSKPKLIRGEKFDLRLYVLITSVDPLRIYLYTDGLVRFATTRYVNDVNCRKDRCMHLTNTNINKRNNAYRVSSSVNSQTGHLWSLKTLWKYLESDGTDVQSIWKRIKDIVVKTVISGEYAIDRITKNCSSSRYSCFEILGFDIILDENYKPWLLEVNCGPSMCNNTPVESAVKGSLLKDALNMAGYQLPNSFPIAEIRDMAQKYHLSQVCHDWRMQRAIMSEREKEKQIFFVGNCRDRKDYLDSIIENLTPDDIRHLIPYEDELTQIGNFEKLFPTVTSHRYFHYFRELKYYNMLFDAWETAYGDNRDEGIIRLQKMCRERYHLVLAK